MSSRPTASALPSAASDFGDLLRQLRRRAGMTRRDLAAAVGYSVDMICRDRFVFDRSQARR